MAPSILPRRLFLVSCLAIPATGLLITAYLQNHPLSASKTRTITSSNRLSPTCVSSKSLQEVVNPKHHMAMTDSRLIRLSKQQIGNLSDEEILARFLKGFFGGWVFAPEKNFFAFLSLFGAKFIPAGFSSIEPEGPTISALSEFSRTSLLPRKSLILGGNFMILDWRIKPASHLEPLLPSDQSFLEVGFGDNRKGFAGLHRFEVFRYSRIEDQDAEVTIWYSSVSCNPSINKPPFHSFLFGFHKFYAMSLFRDGIAEVLRAD